MLSAALSLCLSAEGLVPGAMTPSTQHAAFAAERAQLRMGAAAVVAKKAAIVDEVKEVLADSSLMFCARSAGLTVNEINAVRQKLPEGTTMRCVKNTLVKRAVEDYPQFQGGDSLLEYSNFWFFVPEAEIRSAVETWGDFIKDTKKDDNAILGGVFEGELFDAKGIEALTKLPTKQEQMGTVAALLKAMPTKLARGVKGAGAERIAKALKEAQGQKLGRAVNAMKDKL